MVLQLARAETLARRGGELRPAIALGHRLQRLDQSIGIALACPDQPLAIQLALGEGFESLFGRILDDAKMMERDPQRAGLLRHRVLRPGSRALFGKRFEAERGQPTQHALDLLIAARLQAHLAALVQNDLAIIVVVHRELLHGDMHLGVHRPAMLAQPVELRGTGFGGCGHRMSPPSVVSHTRAAKTPQLPSSR